MKTTTLYLGVLALVAAALYIRSKPGQPKNATTVPITNSNGAAWNTGKTYAPGFTAQIPNGQLFDYLNQRANA
jgi:hypothetical protein